MKFSNEAMRDVLLYIEEKQQYQGDIEYRKLSTFSLDMIMNDKYFAGLFSKHKYSKDELQYTIEKMIEGNILKYSGNLETCYSITEISFRGIQLLNSIRPETTWEKTKSIANKVGNHTLSFIEDTAQKIAATATAALISSITNPK